MTHRGNEADQETARSCRQKLLDWKFNPDNVSQATSQWHNSHLRSTSNIPYGERRSRPMVIFAQLGDLGMLRYILRHTCLSKYSELHLTDEHGLFPMYTAISEPNSEEQVLKVCQWLHAQGANLNQTVGDEWSCLSRACLKGYKKVALWLIKSGALLLPSNVSAQEPRFFASCVARRDLPSKGVYDGLDDSHCSRIRHVHSEIFRWAKETLATREAFLWVLRGMILPPETTDIHQAVAQRLYPQVRLRLNNRQAGTLASLLKDVPPSKLRIFYEMTLSPLRLLNGHPGIMEHISSYLGVETNRDILCTARGLVNHEVWWTLSFSGPKNTSASKI